MTSEALQRHDRTRAGHRSGRLENSVCRRATSRSLNVAFANPRRRYSAAWQRLSTSHRPSSRLPNPARQSMRASLRRIWPISGIPGFRHPRRSRQTSKNPAAVLLSALRSEHLEPRSAEALPWLVVTFPALDWHWLIPRVKRVKTFDLQNKVGFVVTLARQVAERTNLPAVDALLGREHLLERSRLVREDVFGPTMMTEVEKQWSRSNRSPEASHWNLLSSLTAEHLSHPR